MKIRKSLQNLQNISMVHLIHVSHYLVFCCTEKLSWCLTPFLICWFSWLSLVLKWPDCYEVIDLQGNAVIWEKTSSTGNVVLYELEGIREECRMGRWIKCFIYSWCCKCILWCLWSFTVLKLKCRKLWSPGAYGVLQISILDFFFFLMEKRVLIPFLLLFR